MLVAVTDAVVAFAHSVVDPPIGTVLRLCVDPDYRRRGIGFHLLDATRSEPAGRVRAMVLAADDPGAAFYRAGGFERRSTGETAGGGDAYPEHVYERLAE